MMKEMIMMRIHALLATAAAMISTAAAAAPVPQSIAVEAGDLDLGSNKGQRILAMRIERAARTMCRAQAVESLPQNNRSERGCIQAARDGAEAAVKTLTAARVPASARGD